MKIRSRLDLTVRVEGQSVQIYNIRGRWIDPAQHFESETAKATMLKLKVTGKYIGCRVTLIGIAILQMHLYGGP